MIDDIHIFMCSWNRLENINFILNSINSQNDVKNKYNIYFHIWNNNIKKKDELNCLINDFLSCSTIKIVVDVHHSEINLYAFARFIHIKQLKESYNYDYVIIIDDDQYFDHDYFFKLWNLKKKHTMVTWYGAILNGRKYTNREIINLNDLINNKKTFIKEFEYGGPGGCVIDVDIVNYDIFMNTIIKEHLIADDIWLSYILHTLDWKIERSFLPPHMFENANDVNNAMFFTVAKNKNLLYDDLLKKGWKGKKENCIIICSPHEHINKKLFTILQKCDTSADIYIGDITKENQIGYKRVFMINSIEQINLNYDDVWKNYDV